jgi:sucrose-6F-phosphate phosphohydrolase
LLLCTDLDRTLLPNGPQSESPRARERLARLVSHPEVTLAYVSGRHRELVLEAMEQWDLPTPDWVIGDVGTTLWRVAGDDWRPDEAWAQAIGEDWAGRSRQDLQARLEGFPGLDLQPEEKQNRHKLSYFLPGDADTEMLALRLRERLEAAGVRARLVFSIDETTDQGLLDVLPERASKRHAIEALMERLGLGMTNTVFCGDSGNDLEVLTSPIPAVLVANATDAVRDRARRLAADADTTDRLYCARGGFLDMNGHYAAGMLEGIAHFHPMTVAWMTVGECAS